MLEVVLLVFLSAGSTIPADISIKTYNQQFTDKMNARIEYHNRKREDLIPYVLDTKIPEYCDKQLRKIRLAYDKVDESVRKNSMCLIEDHTKN